MKNLSKYFCILALILMSMILVSACTGSASGADEDEGSGIENQVDPDADINELPDTAGIFFEEEAEDFELEKVAADTSQYVGSWEATSDQALHLYGNLNLTVKDDGSWEAVITDENYSGTWEAGQDSLDMKGDRFSFVLSFASSGNLILTETGEGYEYRTVLTKK